MTTENKKETVMSCVLTPDGETTNCHTTLRGEGNMLCLAFEHLSVAFLENMTEALGKEDALGVYSHVQIEALKEAGLGEDFEKFEEEAEAFVKHRKEKERKAKKDAKDELVKALTELLNELGGEEDA